MVSPSSYIFLHSWSGFIKLHVNILIIPPYGHIAAGQVMLDRPLAPNSHHYCKVLCVSPVAAPYSATLNFRVEGFNLVSSSSRYFIIIYNLHMLIDVYFSQYAVI